VAASCAKAVASAAEDSFEAVLGPA
jgi:hypothetical protein